MVDPSPPLPATLEKAALRSQYRQLREDHVALLPTSLRALILNRPPGPVADMMPAGTTVGLYHEVGAEAPATGWARWLAERGCKIALPWFASREAAMEFRIWDNPHDEDVLVRGPWGALQPGADSAEANPDIVVVPLVAFTASGQRLGQGGGHYDRWLGQRGAQVPAIGLAWDCQLAQQLPREQHDQPLAAVVTPTRIYEGNT